LADYQQALAECDRARAEGRRAVAAFGLDGLVALAQAEAVEIAARRAVTMATGWTWCSRRLG